MVLFIASELMFFGGLFASYFMIRSATPKWPPDGISLDLKEPTVLTAVITLTTVTIYLARRGIGRDDVAAMRRWVWATFALGLCFLAIEYHEWANTDFKISTNAYGSLFYTMTGFHGLHVLIGLALLLGLIAASRRPVQARGGAEAIAYYWHFLYAVWLGLYGVIYLLR